MNKSRISPIEGQAPESDPDRPDLAHAAPSANGTPRAEAVPDAPPAGAEDDPFDLESLRLSQDFASSVGVKKVLRTVPVKKPAKEWFVRTHPTHRFETAVLELKEDREIYLVGRRLWDELATEPTFAPRLLVESISRQGVLFLWPLKLPGPDGRIDEWSRSALDAADEAGTRWVRVTANMHLGAYEIATASGKMADPEWPELSLQEIIRIAFRDRIIEDWDHPVLRRLRGEA